MKLRQTNLLLAWLATTAFSVVVAFGLYASGKAADCKPGQMDGQCGLATFSGLLYGVFIGLAIFLSGTIVCSFVVLRRRRVAAQQAEPDGNTL
jgi:hypothetical protein